MSRTQCQHTRTLFLLAYALAIGAGEARAGTEGASNTFFGAGAGTAMTTNRNATFVGAQAGNLNTFGSNNTFAGNSSGAKNTTGNYNTFVGYGSGGSNLTGSYNTFVGETSGQSNTNGTNNTFIGNDAGLQNTTGVANTFVGDSAGFRNETGAFNVFLGWGAGLSEMGSNKLYIDNCYGGMNCVDPLIYGEFDNHLLDFNAELRVNANGVQKSQMHFSRNGTDVGGWITSALDNNFFLSSGTMYDGPNGGWIQKSPDGKSAIVGTQTANGYIVFLQQGLAVGARINPALVPRLQVDYDGHVGLGKDAIPGRQIDVAGGAYLSTGGVWTNVSSRAAKENITELSGADAMKALEELTPVTYNYKVDAQEKHVGFIAEDVPELVATQDRKGLSALDIVAVLTKALQEKSRLLDEQIARQNALAATVRRLEADLNALKRPELTTAK